MRASCSCDAMASRHRELCHKGLHKGSLLCCAEIHVLSVIMASVYAHRYMDPDRQSL